MPPEAILGGIAPRLLPPSTVPARGGRRRIRDTLDRLEEPSRLGATPRDPHARQAAAYAVRRLTQAGDRLDAAHKTAGVPNVPKVGENLRAQRVLAARSPEGTDLALTWIRAEIEYLVHLASAVQAERAAGVLTLAASWQFPEVVDPEIERRIGALQMAARAIECDQRGVLPVEYDHDKLESLDRAIADQVARVRQKGRHEPADVSMRRVMALALSDAPHIPRLARDLAGQRYEQLVLERVQRAMLNR